MKCPLCNGKQVGRIGENSYYCRDCYLEYSLSDDLAYLYDILEDGSRESLGELSLE